MYNQNNHNIQNNQQQQLPPTELKYQVDKTQLNEGVKTKNHGFGTSKGSRVEEPNYRPRQEFNRPPAVQGFRQQGYGGQNVDQMGQFQQPPPLPLQQQQQNVGQPPLPLQQQQPPLPLQQNVGQPPLQQQQPPLQQQQPPLPLQQNVGQPPIQQQQQRNVGQPPLQQGFNQQQGQGYNNQQQQGYYNAEQPPVQQGFIQQQQVQGYNNQQQNVGQPPVQQGFIQQPQPQGNMAQQRQQQQQPRGNMAQQRQQQRMLVGNLQTNEHTADPSSLPRPTYSQFNSVIEQPDTTPLFVQVTKSHRNVVMDKVQSSSIFLRSTIQCAPNTPTLLNKYGLPFGITFHPFSVDNEVPLINLGFNEVIRCSNCRGYVNPFVVFLDRGHKWRCNLCKTINTVPDCYFSKLDDHGVRVDLKRRKELREGSVEFVAPKRYKTRLTYHPTCFLFLIDVSYNSVVSGALKIICNTILKTLDNLKSGRATKIGIITYDRSIHFYNLNPKNKDPKIMVVGELNESLLPLPKYLLGTLGDSRDLIEKVLKMIPTKVFPKNESMDSCLFSALNSAHRLISRIGGKIVTFLCNLPQKGIKSLKNRGITTYYNSDVEKSLLKPVDKSYKERALEFTKDVVSIDLFCISEQYLDVATLGCLTKYTTGKLRYYSEFNKEIHGGKLRNDIIKSTVGVCGFDAVMKIRVSKGLKVENFYGNFFVKGHDLLSLPYVDEYQGFGIELTHSESFISTQNCSIQAAILYTNPSGERRIRVHNLTLPISSDLGELYKNCDIYSSIDLLGKKLVDDVSRNGLENQKVNLIKSVVQCLRTYRMDVRRSSMQQYNQLILADNIRLLPLYSLALMKSNALIEGSDYVTLDKRMASVHELSSSSTRKVTLLIHPSFYDLTSFSGSDMDNEDGINLLPLTKNVINPTGVYLLNDSNIMYVLVGDRFKDKAGINEMVDIQGYLNKIDDLNEGSFEESILQKKESLNTQIGESLFKISLIERDKYGYIPIQMISLKSKESIYFYKKLIEDHFYESPFRYSYERHIVLLHQKVVKQ